VLRKQRSGPQGEEFPFQARVVDMGEDQDGEPLTSRVIDWDVERVERVKPEKKTQAQLVYEEALTRTYKEHQERIKVNGAEVDAVQEELLRSAFKELYEQSKPGVSVNAMRQAWWKAIEKMKGRIEHSKVGGVLYVWYPSGPI
jgi:hypothetical protein